MLRTQYTGRLFDASAAVRLVVDEPGSEPVRKYFAEKTGLSHVLMSSVCFVEALSALKRKWLRRELSQEQYTNRCFDLTSLLWQKKIALDETNLDNFAIFQEAERIAGKYSLDMIDALQIVTLQSGFLGSLGGASKAILITADENLAKAAASEGLRSWNCVGGTPPPD